MKPDAIVHKRQMAEKSEGTNMNVDIENFKAPS